MSHLGNHWVDGEGWTEETDAPPAGPCQITPLMPVDRDAVVAPLAPIYLRISLEPTSIQFGDDGIVGLETIRVTVNGSIWMIDMFDLDADGAAEQTVNGVNVKAIRNAYNGWDLKLTPTVPYPFYERTNVLVVAQDDYDVTTVKAYSFMVGVGPRLVEVINPFDNVLVAYFNEPMLANGAFLNPQSWHVAALGDAEPLEITSVEVFRGRPAIAQLGFTGLDSVYELSVHGVTNLDGVPLEPGFDSAEFEILFGDHETPTVRLFNSIFGPLGIRQSVRTRRSMDDHVVNRSIALGLDEQFRLRLQQLDATAGRDGRPGKRRT